MRSLLKACQTILLLSMVLLITSACGSAKVTVSSLTVEPPMIAPNGGVTVAANVLSYETKPVNYRVNFRAKGAAKEIAKETKDITLAAGETATVSFECSTPDLGTYEVEINGQKASFKVVKPAEFSVTGLAANLEKLITGAGASVVVDVKNSGELPGTYVASLKVDAAESVSANVTVEPGASSSVSLPLKLDVPGNHILEVGGQNKSVRVYKAAKFEASSLSVSPASIFVGQSASAEATITNTGEVAGTFPVAVTVGGSESGSQSVSLEPGASQKVTFTVSPKGAGSSSVTILNSSGSLSVTQLSTYASNYWGYQMSYPPGFTVDEENWSDVYFDGGSSAGIAISAERVSSGETARAYLDRSLAVSKVANQGWTNTTPTEITEGGATIGYKFDYTMIAGGKGWSGKAALFKRAGLAFQVEYAGIDSDWSRNKDLASLCLDAFKLPGLFSGGYSSSTLGISLSLPADWTLVERFTSDAIVASVISPYNKAPVYGLVVIESVPSGTSAQTYANSVRNGLTGTGFQVASVVPFSFSNGASGYEFTAVRNQASERFVVLVSGTKAYSFLFMGVPSDLSSLSNDTTQMARSLVLTSSAGPSVSRNETLVLAEYEIPTLDPALTEESPGEIVGAMFSGLVRIDKDLRVVPDLADRWTVSPDGKVYTFYLRANAKFHDGRQVTAGDFKYSWERACDPATKSPKAASYLNDIVGAKDMMAGRATAISGVKVVDATTLEVTLDAAKVFFPGKITQPVAFVVDRTNVQTGPKWYEKPNGTGPFKLKEWVKDDRLLLERNDSFYSSPAKMKNLLFKLYPGSAMTLYQNGEIDITAVPNADLDKVLDVSNPLNRDVKSASSFGTGYIGLNVTKAPFDDPKVRLAFARALDVNKLIELSMKGRAERAAGYVPPGVPGFNSALQPIPFDPASAKQLIAESRYKSVDQLPPVTVYVPYGASAFQQAAIGMWQQNLGIQVKVEVVSTIDEYYARFHRREFQVAFGSWRADYVDPQDFLDVLFQSQSPENVSAYSNSTVDAALVDAAAETNEAARIKKYQDIEKLILADLPTFPTYRNAKDYVLVKPYVQGYSLNPVGVNIWTEISLLPH